MQPPMDFSIGARARAARHLAGYTKPDDLAQELARRGVRGLGRTTLYSIEAGRQEGTIPQLRELAEACGVPLAWFTADFSRLDEISEDPRTVLAQQTAGALARSRARRRDTGAATEPLRVEDQRR